MKNIDFEFNFCSCFFFCAKVEFYFVNKCTKITICMSFLQKRFEGAARATLFSFVL